MSTRRDAPRVGVLPKASPSLRHAILGGGGEVGEPDEAWEGLIVDFTASVGDLERALTEQPGLRWVQLPSAGIEAYSAAIKQRSELIWTSAKGAYASPVAEHALALTLALLRDLPERVAATAWGAPSGTRLSGSQVVVVGAGGVGRETVRLLNAFGAHVSVVRREALSVAEAKKTVTLEQLPTLLTDADVVILAAALTPSTRGMMGTLEFSRMKPSAVLVNIGRGGLVDTSALVSALESNRIRGAALDVTDPEPLPDGHRLWRLPNALITPHTADTMEMIVPLFAERVAENVRLFRAGAQMSGLVNIREGY